MPHTQGSNWDEIFKIAPRFERGSEKQWASLKLAVFSPLRPWLLLNPVSKPMVVLEDNIVGLNMTNLKARLAVSKGLKLDLAAAGDPTACLFSLAMNRGACNF